MNIDPLYEPDGRPSGAIAVIQDVTGMGKQKKPRRALAAIVRIVRRCYRQQRSKRYYHQLESRRGAALWLFGRGSYRQADNHADSAWAP